MYLFLDSGKACHGDFGGYRTLCRQEHSEHQLLVQQEDGDVVFDKFRFVLMLPEQQGILRFLRSVKYRVFFECPSTGAVICVRSPEL